jgi:hypothetical protein
MLSGSEIENIQCLSGIETFADCCLMSKLSNKIVLDYGRRRKLCLEVVDDYEQQAQRRAKARTLHPSTTDRKFTVEEYLL